MRRALGRRPTTPAPAPIRVVYERPKPRIAQGLCVLLVSGIFGLLIFAMGQSAWGAIWRGWLVNLLILGVFLFVL